jgi:hypothetical protein
MKKSKGKTRQQIVLELTGLIEKNGLNEVILFCFRNLILLSYRKSKYFKITGAIIL